MTSPRFHPLVRLICCALAVLVAQAAAGGVLLATNTALAMTGPPLAPRAALLAIFLATPLTLLAVWLCRHFLDGRSLASLGLRARRLAPDFVMGALCGVAAVAFICGVLWLTGNLEVLGLSERARAVGTGGIALRLTIWATAMLGVALMEEVTFRGYALHNLGAWLGQDKIGLGAAAILQGLLFALIHVANFGTNPSPDQIAAAWQATPNIFLIGVFFALCAYKTGALWFPIGFHAAWNFCLGCVFSLPVSGQQFFRLYDVKLSPSHWLTGGPFGAEGSVLLTAITALLIYLVRQSDDHPQAIADIKALLPRDETEDDVDVASRAPRLRERKAQRQTQTVTKPTFEGWNDMAPPERRPTFTTFKPPTATPNANPIAEANAPFAPTVPAAEDTPPAPLPIAEEIAPAPEETAPAAPPIVEAPPVPPAPPPAPKKSAPRW